jgi:trimethylamine--corrinoid protein Co-methyltransferase
MTAARLVVWTDEECRRVHEAALGVLVETGVEVKWAPARELFAAAGARIDDTRVRLDAAAVERALASAPRSWTVRSRGRDEIIELRDGETYFGTGSDCLYVRDPDTHERRRILLDDVEGMAALCETLPDIDFVMSMGLPADVPQEVDDVSAALAMLKGTRKPLMVAPRNGFVLPHLKDMCNAAGGADSLMIYAMPAPPLQHDKDGLSKVAACAELEIPIIYASAPNCGTTAPRSIAAASVLNEAEVLSGLVLHQQVRPGAPFVYGTGVGAMDMRAMTEAYCVPESMLGQAAQCDLARWHGLPSFNYAGFSDSKTLDGQWAAECAWTALAGGLSRSTLLHDVGYLESGLQSSYESILFGAEMCGFARAYMKDVATDDEALALDEIAAIGPGGTFLATKHTRRHTRDFWLGSLIDRTMHDRWVTNGSLRLLERLEARVAELRAAPRGFALDTAVVAEIEAIMARAGEEREA